jgi:peptidoglycan DL-endopeptidase CwlO
MAATIPYASLFTAAGAKYHIDPALLAAVAKAESGFNPNAVSPAGAIGLMQIMPSTAAGLNVDPRDPAQAVDGAARLLKQNLQKFGSDALAVAAYNAGPGAVSQYGGIPPYAETQNYVKEVLAYRDQFEGMLGSAASTATKVVVGVGLVGAAWLAFHYVKYGRLPKLPRLL